MHLFSVYFVCNSVVTPFILTRMYVIRTFQIRIKIMLNRDFPAFTAL